MTMLFVQQPLALSGSPNYLKKTLQRFELAPSEEGLMEPKQAHTKTPK